MNEQEIREAVVALLKRIAPDAEPEALGPDENIRESLAMDSFDFLRFMVALEERLGVSIPEQEYGGIRTMKALLSHIAAQKKGSGNG